MTQNIVRYIGSCVCVCQQKKNKQETFPKQFLINLSYALTQNLRFIGTKVYDVLIRVTKKNKRETNGTLLPCHFLSISQTQESTLTGKSKFKTLSHE